MAVVPRPGGQIIYTDPDLRRRQIPGELVAGTVRRAGKRPFNLPETSPVVCFRSRGVLASSLHCAPAGIELLLGPGWRRDGANSMPRDCRSELASSDGACLPWTGRAFLVSARRERGQLGAGERAGKLEVPTQMCHDIVSVACLRRCWW